MIDVAQARAETPGVAHVTHLNNAGSALPPSVVLEAVVGHLQREAEIGGYEAAAERDEQLEHAYDALGTLLNCAREELAVVENATRAWDMAFYGFHFERGDRILTGRAEYASNWIALRQVAARTGASVEIIPDDESGQVDVDALEAMLDGRVKLVSLVHVPTQSGLVNPAAEVGAVTSAAGIPLLLDACQSVGQMPIDVTAIGCDVLSGTARKFLRGPRGVGFLYVRRELIDALEPPFLDMHAAEWQTDGSYRIRADARRFENWETNFAGKVGLGVAADYALGWGLEAIQARVQELAGMLRAGLEEIGEVTVHDRGRSLSGTVTFSVAGHAADEVAAALAHDSVNVSVARASAARLDFDPRGLESVVRSSVHYYNDDDELDRLLACVARLIRDY